MKMKSILLSLIILAFAASDIFSQGMSVGRKIDEFSVIECDEINAKFDNFAVELASSPSQGVIIIYGSKNDPVQKYVNENMIVSHLRMKQMNSVKIIRGADLDKAISQFWIFPAGFEGLASEESKWDYSLREIKKPFVFYVEWGSPDGICPPLHEKELAAKFLQANPMMNANVVVYTRSQEKFGKIRRAAVKEFKKEYGIPQNRFKFFASSKKKQLVYELWLVPKGKK